MRNVVVSNDAAAQAAGTEVVGSGGNAADAVLAAMLAGAARASAASLLGSGVVLLAGPGVGAQFVDGRARAPGLGERRPSAPADPPQSWRAAVPGLLEAVLTTHARFGTAALGTLTRAASSAVKEVDQTPSVRARLSVLDALPRSGINALERLGVLQAILEAAGPAAGGVISRDDLAAMASPVRPLVELRADEHEVLVAPADPPVRFAPPPVPRVPVGCALCADMHGVTACAVWAVAPEAVALAGTTGLGLAALSNAPTKGVTRRRPASPVPLALPAALVRQAGRVWAAVAVAGEGNVERARDGLLGARLATVGIGYAPPDAPREGLARDDASARGLALWVMHDASGDVRASAEALTG